MILSSGMNTLVERRTVSTTTYHILILVRSENEPVWRYLGPVEAVGADAARSIALGRERIETATAVAVPDRSWNPEVFTTKLEAPKYVKGTAAAHA
jgi:hypothetical protein